jgi:hypothetical protein
MNRQELGQLHCLFKKIHHNLTWREQDETNNDYSFNIVNTDWSHLNNNTDPDYAPDLGDYHDVGVVPIDFLAPREDIKDAGLELVSAIADELTEELNDTAIETTSTTTNTASTNGTTPGRADSDLIADDAQTTLAGYAD